MFTGLIETTGKLSSFTPKGNYRVLTISTSFSSEKTTIGESIACDGVCLTVVKFDQNSFTVEVSQESLEKTIIGTYKTDSRINLERALKMGDRLGGHMVSGHIDTVGKIVKIQKIGESYEIDISYEPEFDSLVIEKGSIAINGISLTVNRVGSGLASVNIIPHTWDNTNLVYSKTNDPVNLEFDMIGKFIQKQNRNSSPLTIQKLKESGW